MPVASAIAASKSPRKASAMTRRNSVIGWSAASGSLLAGSAMDRVPARSPAATAKVMLLESLISNPARTSWRESRPISR